MVVLRGQRVVLRDLTLDDLDAYAEWLRPDHLWRDYDGPYYHRPDEKEIAVIIRRVRRSIRTGDWPGPRRMLTIADLATDLLLGTVSRYWVGEETNWAAAGIAIYDPAHWGRGLGYEALGIWCDYLFAAEPRFARLDLRTWSGNERMMRLAEKLGFKLEARYRKARVVDGRFYDALGYGVLREEWEARYPGGFSAPPAP